MMMWQQKSKKHILTCVSVIGALILASALVFVGCEEASPPADTTPPAQSVTIDNVRVATASITFDVSNPNAEAVNVTVAIAPPLDTARIVVDGAEKAIAEAVIALAANGTQENIQITNLENGTTYTITLTTADSNGNQQSQKTTNTATPLTPPDVPTNLTATSGNGSVVLNWTAPAGGTTVTQYHVYRAEGDSISGATRLPATVSTTITETNYTDSSAENGTQYTYSVRAINTNGTESADSNTASATPFVSSAPTGLTAIGRNGDVVLNWTVPTSGPAVSRYHVYRAVGADVSSATRLPNTTPAIISTPDYTDYTAENGTQYSYFVRAVTADGTESGNSNAATATPRLFPGVPTSLTVTTADKSVSLTWTAPTGGSAVASYRIYRALGNGPFIRLPTTPALLSATTFTYTDDTVINSTTYRYFVRAVDGSGMEGSHSEFAIAVLPIAPDAPTALTATAGNGQVALNWNALFTAIPVGQFYIYRAVGADISSAIRLNNTTPLVITDTLYTDRTVENGTQYTYAVRSVNFNNGAQSENSNTVSATPSAPEGAPNNLDATATDGSVSLTWTAPAGSATVSSYRIYRAAGSDALARLTTTPETLPATTTTYTDGSVTNGTEYRYTVRAVNSGTESPDSETATVTPLAPPDAPTLTATARNGEVWLGWTAPANAGTVSQYYIYRAVGAGSRERLTTNSPVITTSYTDRGLTNGTEYSYAVRTVNVNDAQSANSNVVQATPRLPAPQNVRAVATSAPQVTLTWDAVENASEYRIYRTVLGGSEERLTTTPPMLTATTTTYTDSSIMHGIVYYYRIQAVTGLRSATIRVEAPVDSDNDMLIDIQNLDMLNNIRHNLAGTSYKSSSGDSGLQCGMDGTTACTGYELMRDLDFAVAGDYASGSVNMAWRPTASGSVVASGSATNSGWQPIGGSSLSESLSTIFEGNGRSISNLYVRNTAARGSNLGLFSQLNNTGTLRNLLIEDSNVYGGSMDDFIGVAVGASNGTIANVVVRGGSVHGGNGSDQIGALVGAFGTTSSVVASSATATVNGDDGLDYAGGLVGYMDGGRIVASYAGGTVNGGAGSNDAVGGLFGAVLGSGAIYASYATGNVSDSMGHTDLVGGFFGQAFSGTTIVASYATGNADGGDGLSDQVGKFGGQNLDIGTGPATLTANYGFGTTSGGETAGVDGSTLPSGVTMAPQLTAPGSAATTAVAAEWNQATSNSLNAWNFGSNTQPSVLRYADYDGTGGTDYCALFSVVPGTRADITCGTTLLPHQR